MSERILRKPSWKAYLLAARPKTLTAAIVPIVAATALAKAYGGEASILIFFSALASALCIQIGTNLVNDALDFLKGADGEGRSGPLRATQQGFLTHRQVMGAGILFFICAIACGIPLILKGGTPIAVLLAVSVLLGYGYTGGPAPLAYIGMGDLFVVLFFGIASTAAVFYLQQGILSLPPFIAGIQIGLLAAVMIAINNLRDRNEDRKAGKRTLAVRFGERFSKIEITAALLLPFVLNVFWLLEGFSAAAALPLLTFPLAVKISLSIWGESPGKAYNKFLAQSAALHLLFGVLLSAGFFLL